MESQMELVSKFHVDFIGRDKSIIHILLTPPETSYEILGDKTQSIQMYKGKLDL